MSKSVHNPWSASVVAIGDVRASVGFVACGVIGVPRSVATSARQRIAQRTDLPFDAVMITASLTREAVPAGAHDLGNAVFKSPESGQVLMKQTLRLLDGKDVVRGRFAR